MSKRNDTPHDSQLPDDASGADQQADAGIKRIAAPRLVPSQDGESAAIGTDVVTVSYEEAARDAAGGAAGADDVDDGPAIAAFRRTRRFIPLAAAIAIAAAVGALTGALATTGLGHFSGDVSASAALREDNQKFEAAIAKVGRDIAALKSNLDSSARSVTAQMARLSERLEKTDKAQGDAAGKLAKLAETFERNASAPATTTAAAASGLDRDVTGSIGTTTPAAPTARTAPAVVQGWVLRGVQNGTALIQGRIGLVEVEPGDNLPGLGRIAAIRRQDGRWVVVTSRGLIMPR